MTVTDIELIIFDLDGTLVDFWGNIYGGVYDMLNDLKKNGKRLVLASYNINGENILKRHKISHFFETIKCQDWHQDGIDNKQQMLSEILKVSNVSPENIIFVDDQHRFLETAVKLGMNTHFVKSRHGLNCELFKTVF